MAKQDTPISYKDPFWSNLSDAVEQKLELPAGLLKSVLLYGERSNANQVSEAGAKTPYQITPSTRQLVLDKYGVDAYLSPETSAEAAGLLLKESLQRNKGDIKLAAAEYHGGTDKKNWGPRTRSYVDRVSAAMANARPSIDNGQSSTFQAALAASPNAQVNNASIANIYNAYTSGQMTPEEAADFESDVKSGSIMLPRGAALRDQPEPPALGTQDSSQVMELPAAVADAYNSGRMTREEMIELESDVKNGMVRAPNNMQIKGTEPLGFFGSVKEAITGSDRETPTTRDLPDWAMMPELNTASMASFKSALGTMVTNPQETVQVIQANYPGVGVSQDEKGNYVLKSSIDGGLYVIKPGFALSDIPRAAGAIAAFTPAGRATTLGGMALGAGATQAAIEASKVATGGNFNVGDIAASAALAPVLPAAIRGVQAVRAARAPATSAVATPDTLPTSAPPAPVAPTSSAAAQNIPVAQPIAAAPVNMTMQEVADTARKASVGGLYKHSAIATLAEQAQPDQKVLAAAKRLGIEQYLQPDHLTANQAYRELAQAVKSVPGSVTRSAEIQKLTALGQQADELIARIGGTTDLSALNQSIRNKMDNTITGLSNQAKKAYDDLRDSIPSQTRGNANNVLEFVNQRAQDLDGAKNLSSLEKMVYSKLTPKAIKDKKGKITGYRSPTYALIDDVRRDIGAAARQAGPFSDADTGLAKKLYQLIDDDQFAIADAAGQGASYGLAKSLVKMRKGFEDDMMSLFGQQLDQSMVGKLGTATTSLASGDADKFAKILTAVPKDMRQMVTASALNTAFGKATQNGTLNFNTYAKWYEGLLENKQAYTALMANLTPSARKSLSDLYRVSSNVSKATRERITTGRIQAVQTELQGADSLLSSIYGVAKRAAIGLPLEAATTSVGLPGAGIASGLTAALTKAKPDVMRAADELISSPQFERLAVEAATTGNNPSRATVKLFVASPAFKKFAQRANLPKENSALEKFVLQVMLGSSQYDEGDK